MEPQAGSSFIPKKPLAASTARRGGGFFMFVGLLIFVASLAAAGGVFGYEQLLKKSIADKDASLKRAEGAFETGTIQDLVRLDSRMREAEKLFASHVAPSAVFNLLSDLTLERVQFTGFNYTLRTDGTATVLLTGVADSFSALALQSDQMGASKALRNIVFSGITTDQGGRAVFTVEAAVQAPDLLYAKYLGTGTAPAPVPLPAGAGGSEASTTQEQPTEPFPQG